jgi:hypothetical protein
VAPAEEPGPIEPPFDWAEFLGPTPKIEIRDGQVYDFSHNENIRWEQDLNSREGPNGLADMGLGLEPGSASAPLGNAASRSTRAPQTFTFKNDVRERTDSTATTLGQYYKQVGTTPNAPFFYSVPNSRGGRVFVSTVEIDQTDFAKLVVPNFPGGIKILSGTHGDDFGEFYRYGNNPGWKFFPEDDQQFSNIPGVEVYDVFSLTFPQLQAILNSEGRIICAFCMSEANPQVQEALGH